MSNSIMIIHPYNFNGMWVFDDPAVGLDKEPFVSGADDIIDVMVADLPGAEKGFNLVFSAIPFPGHEHCFTRRDEDSGGYWYEYNDTQFQGWLCPALFKYFDEAPEKLYVQVKM